MKEKKIKSKAAWPSAMMTAALFSLLFTAPAIAQQQEVQKAAADDSSATNQEKQAGNNFHSSFASAEFALNGTAVVRGAPFSAVAIKETTQALANGRTFVRRMTASIYRDGEGRTRLEWGNTTKQPGEARMAMIYDAVTGASYLLGKRGIFPFPGSRKDDAATAIERRVKIITPESPPEDIAQAVGESVERLGTKTLEGVAAEGVRLTSTIPAAALKDGQPNKVVFERWYSQELRRNVLIKVTDPRFGEAVYRLTNIDRAEPPRELFIVPATEPARESKPSSVGRAENGSVTLKFERGSRVAVDNRTTGKIVVIGWDKDFVEARATSERGAEAVRYAVGDDSVGNVAGDSDGRTEKRIWLKGDYANREEIAAVSPPQPTPEAAAVASASTPSSMTSAGPTVLQKQIRLPGVKYDGPSEPPMRDGSPIEVSLEVRVPRYAEIELIKVNRSPVEIMGVETPLTILGNRGNVILRDVGKAEVRTQSGPVEVDGASGLVEVITSSGLVRVRRAAGDVRALSISGDVEVECVRGRVNADSTSGAIRLANIRGDVVAATSASNLSFAGAIREDGRYQLKTMSGTIEMSLRDKPLPGFTVVLSSYRGQIENDFQLNVSHTSEREISRTTEIDGDDVNRRVIGRHGSGRAQITLDSFDGKVRLLRLAPGAATECK